MLWENLKAQRRVLAALMIRETYTRFGRENLGFLWLVGEPLVFALPVLGMWSLIRAKFEHGLPMLAMAWTGYLPILLFRHTCALALRCVRVNAGLLYHRQVSVFDLVFARMLLEACSNVMALIASGFLLYLLGAIDPPKNWPLFYLGYLFHIWWAMSAGLILAGLSERSELVEKIWSPISYMYLMLSGFFYLAEWLPDNIRKWALLVVPPLHPYEMIRSGLLGDTFHAYYDIGYIASLYAVLTLIGLVLMRDVRDYLELE
jgi:capsular polysaccharide transport system permease protein